MKNGVLEVVDRVAAAFGETTTQPTATVAEVEKMADFLAFIREARAKRDAFEAEMKWKYGRQEVA